MQTELKKAIEVLRQQVMDNLAKINETNGMVRFILATEAVSETRRKKINALQEYNKQLLLKNKDLLDAQLQLLKVLQTNKQEYVLQNQPLEYTESGIDEQLIVPAELTESKKTVVNEIPVVYSVDEYFEQIISGKVIFNKEHPLFYNEQFYQRLMKHYISTEEYEICDRLYKMKN